MSQPASRLVLLPVLLLALMPAGCGVPLDEAPRSLERQGPVDASNNPVPDGVGTSVVRLYLIRDGRLVRVPRRVPSPRDPQQQLADLLAGPTADESEDGLTSALTTMRVVDLQVISRRAVITLADRAEQGVRSDEVLAFGQIVCTLTTQPDVGTVSFVADGQPLGVPRADGSLSPGPLTIADYNGLLD